MPRIVQVFAASRLHFGLLSPGWGERQFGGVGVMVDRPGLRLVARKSSTFSVLGPLANRTDQFARRWAETNGIAPNCEIEVLDAPPQHVGLGVGTQLGLSVAAALNACFDLPSATPLELAQSVGRGGRSAVGAHGFVLGGLIVEPGKLPHEVLSPLDCRVDIPADWRFLLLRPQGLTGLSGDDEVAAFPATTPELSTLCDRLRREANEQLVPAAAMADFDAFAASLYRYGHQAGLCFAARQGGPYNGPVLAALVELIRSLGGEGVGQTSWGPTLYVACRDATAAQTLQQRIEQRWTGDAALHFEVAAPWNRPARIEVTGSG